MRTIPFAYSMIALAGSAALSCDDPERSELRDAGAVCIGTGPQNELAVRVEFPTCLSSSCDDVLQNTCSIEQTGTELRITSYAQIESQDTDCTLDCGALTANCTLPNLAPGEYTLRYGSRQVQITAPIEPQYHFGDTTGRPQCSLLFEASADAG